MASAKQTDFKLMDWTDSASLRQCLAERAYSDFRLESKKHRSISVKPISSKSSKQSKPSSKTSKRRSSSYSKTKTGPIFGRPVRVVNLQLWDSILAFENYSFKGDTRSVNPRNPFQTVDEINYELDSQDELQELMGEDADSWEDEYDSECGPVRIDGKGDNQDLVDEGWIVPNDYISDSSDSDVTPRDGENEAEYELRRQQKQIEKEQKR